MWLDNEEVSRLIPPSGFLAVMLSPMRILVELVTPTNLGHYEYIGRWKWI
jgi:hypothetical protein